MPPVTQIYQYFYKINNGDIRRGFFLGVVTTATDTTALSIGCELMNKSSWPRHDAATFTVLEGSRQEGWRIQVLRG